MRQTTASAVVGASLAIAGVGMAFAAAESYFGSVPQSPWILYVYLPISAVLFAGGAFVLVKAQRRYQAGKRG